MCNTPTDEAAEGIDALPPLPRNYLSPPLPLPPAEMHAPGTYSISFRTGQRVDGPRRGRLARLFRKVSRRA